MTIDPTRSDPRVVSSPDSLGWVIVYLYPGGYVSGLPTDLIAWAERFIDAVIAFEPLDDVPWPEAS